MESIIYGTLVLSTFSISLAAKTRTLWKLGLLFSCGWILSNTINSSCPHPYDGSLMAFLYTVVSFLSILIFAIYKCKLSRYISALNFIKILISIYYINTGEYITLILVINLLFILEALIIITSSIINMKRRKKNLNKISNQDFSENSYLKLANDIKRKKYVRT